jgi:hypothetical protein
MQLPEEKCKMEDVKWMMGNCVFERSHGNLPTLNFPTIFNNNTTTQQQI